MSYLHSRGIIHGRLNSRNVFLEAKIKLSLLDHSMAESSPVGEHTGCLAQGLLTYLPPEVSGVCVASPPVATCCFFFYLFLKLPLLPFCSFFPLLVLMFTFM